MKWNEMEKNGGKFDDVAGNGLHIVQTAHHKGTPHILGEFQKKRLEPRDPLGLTNFKFGLQTLA